MDLIYVNTMFIQKAISMFNSNMTMATELAFKR